MTDFNVEYQNFGNKKKVIESSSNLILPPGKSLIESFDLIMNKISNIKE